MARVILFDLDGTLTDPGIGITNSVIYALERLKIDVPSREELYKFIGPPLYDSFQKYFHLEGNQADEAVRLFREYFADRGLEETKQYHGIPEMLEHLSCAGFRMILATSKPEKWAKIIMHNFSLDRWIPEIAGSTLTRDRCKKGQVIAYAMEKYKIDPADAIMVGDREHDVIGAKENGIPCIGVTFGYGDREELIQAGAAAVADDPEELEEILRRGVL